MEHPYDAANTIAMDEALVLADMVSATTVDDAGKRKLWLLNQVVTKKPVFRFTKQQKQKNTTSG